jgi:hypothetical protein
MLKTITEGGRHMQSAMLSRIALLLALGFLAATGRATLAAPPNSLGYTEGGGCTTTGGGPYPGENGTYNKDGDCCWSRCTFNACSTTCADCSGGRCKDAAVAKVGPDIQRQPAQEFQILTPQP